MEGGDAESSKVIIVVIKQSQGIKTKKGEPKDENDCERVQE